MHKSIQRRLSQRLNRIPHEWFSYTMAVLETLLLGTVVTLILTIFVKHRYSFWKRHNVPNLKPIFPFGNFKEMGKTLHPAFLTQRIYNEFKRKGPFVGLYIFLNPVMLVTDLSLAKTILIKDFSYFPNRGVYFNERDDPLSSNLFSQEGKKWKDLRAKITPTFSTGRIRITFPAVMEIGNRLVEYMEINCAELGATEVRDLMARFTTDVIARCAFGLECNSFRDPNNEFRRIGKKHFDTPRNHPLKVFIMKTFRCWANFVGMKQIHDDVSEFFCGVVQETIKQRELDGVTRGDFLDLLIKLKNTGRLEDSGEDIGNLTFDEIAAQAFIFFTAGFETSSSALTYTLYELARNQDVQEMARNNIQEVLKNARSEVLDYECFQNMAYIDQCINETLRKYPPVVNLERVVDRDYALNESGVVLPQGMKIMIPAYAIHHDPDIYPIPNQYNPERFSPEQIAGRDSCSFLPFGEGPRTCIGLRFGMLQVRVGLAMILKSFRILPCPNTEETIIFSKRAFVLTPINGVWLRLEKIK